MSVADGKLTGLHTNKNNSKPSAMDKIIEIRNWFRTNGKMDFEINPDLPKEKQGMFITYKCKDIDTIFERALAETSHENGNCIKPDVNQQSEQLLAFAEYIKTKTLTSLIGEPQHYVDRFLKANNCG